MSHGRDINRRGSPGGFPVHQPPAADPANEQIDPLRVAQLAGRVAEAELGQVAVQVLAADVVEGPLRRPLQLAEVASAWFVVTSWRTYSPAL
jgi:hypothetical protein